jgi:hypothetical protein
MPQLNLMPTVSSLLMQDFITVERRKESVNGYGENGTADQIYADLPAVVYPEGQNKLDRRVEAQSTTKVIGIVTRFALRTATPGWQADTVVWRGNRYLVTGVQDYSQYGAGFVEAMAEAQEVQQTAPETKRSILV